MTDFDFKNKLHYYTSKVDNHLLTYLPDAKDGQFSVVEAMRYSLVNGGKRIRPVLVLEFAKLCGGREADALAFACAVEYVHTYSLIHDDLPCMDDDDMRRGQPSCHKRFGEATALLAGDALLTHAFEIISDSDVSDYKKVDAVKLLSQNAGVQGMIGGQVIDLLFEQGNPTINDLRKVYKLKTGALISAACLLGCISAKATDSQIEAASKFAYALGYAFQIQDDILDVVGDEQKLGKPVGSDAENNKTTYVQLVGMERAKEDVKKFTDYAVSQLDEFKNSEFLKELAIRLINRDK